MKKAQELDLPILSEEEVKKSERIKDELLDFFKSKTIFYLILIMMRYGKVPYLECSSKDDKRFSAFYAIVNGKSIEEKYQTAKIFLIVLAKSKR